MTDDQISITVPRLELDRAIDDEFPLLETVYNYYDYPGGTHEGTTYYQHSSATPEGKIAEMLSDLDVELVVAGNQRTSVETLETMMARGELDRVQIATDTPTGTGVVPCGMWLEAGILASMTDVSAGDVLCLMTGTPAAHNDLDTGVLAEGRPADLCVLDAPLGSVGDDALAAIENGDYPSVSAVLVDGDVLVEGSRNTGPAKNPAEVV